jgi:hypothetical protein
MRVNVLHLVECLLTCLTQVLITDDELEDSYCYNKKASWYHAFYDV